MCPSLGQVDAHRGCGRCQALAQAPLRLSSRSVSSLSLSAVRCSQCRGLPSCSRYEHILPLGQMVTLHVGAGADCPGSARTPSLLPTAVAPPSPSPSLLPPCVQLGAAPSCHAACHSQWSPECARQELIQQVSVAPPPAPHTPDSSLPLHACSRCGVGQDRSLGKTE